MYSDLFDQLGTTGSAGGATGTNTANNNEKSLVTLKAGKMELQLQENGHYWASPDTRRGEVRVVWKTDTGGRGGSLQWEWFDRREKNVTHRHLLYTVGSSTNPTHLGTLEQVTNIPNPAPQDRLYVWTRPNSSSGSATAGDDSSSSPPPEYHMYWLQDADEAQDAELIAKVNQYLADPAAANPSSSTAGAGTSNSTTGATTGSGATGAGTNTNDRQQVDALSNILENLGMPQNDSAAGTAAATSSGTAAAATAASGTLTLADLQGAMAGLQQPSAGGPLPLQELVTPAAISGLLENEDVKKRLMELLPEEQRTPQFLEDNLRSPQVQQTLRSLTAALLPDDTGSMDGYLSVLANFSLDGAQQALVDNNHNTIQAFLDCILKSVEKDKQEDKKDDGEEAKDEEQKEE